MKMSRSKRKKNKNRWASSNPEGWIRPILVILFLFFLPTQLGRHFFFPFSFISGIRVDYLAPTIYLTDILFLGLLVMNFKMVVNGFRNKNLLIILGLLLISVFFALSWQVAAYRYLKILELVAVFFIFRNFKLDFRKITQAFFASSLFTLFLAVLQLVNKSSLQGIFYFFGERFLTLSTPDVAKASLQGIEFLRPYATFSHPNSMAGFFLLVYTFFLVSKQKSLIKNLLIFISALIVLFSFSKIAIITLVLLTAIYFASTWKKVECKFCIASRLIVLAVIGLTFSLAQTDPASVQKRAELLQNSWTIIAASPLLGVGLGNYIIVQSRLAKQLFTLTQPVHNVFILLLAETGVVLFALIFISLYRQFQKFMDFNFLVIASAIIVTGAVVQYWGALQHNFLLLGVILGLITSREAYFSRPR